MYVAWYVNKQLLDVCSMIGKHTIFGCSICKQILDVYSMCKQTNTGCM